jgi:hypothetical protein
VRVVRVPYRDFPGGMRWITRFNARFAVDKSAYDGRFTSRLGRGYCTYAGGRPWMEYTFLDVSDRKHHTALSV